MERSRKIHARALGRFLGARVLATAILCGGWLGAAAHAQIDVRLELNRGEYVRYELVQATVTVTNLAGSDVVLAGAGGLSWLTFDLRGTGDVDLSPAEDLGLEPVVLPAGQRISRSMILNGRYPISQRGNYSLRANVFFPPLQRYVPSNSLRFDVNEGRVFWEKVIGVSQDLRAGGSQYRRYQMMTFQNREGTLLYVRVRDERSQQVYGTYPLGQVLLQRPPQVTVDRNGLLHVLWLGAPRTYAHVTIGPDARQVEKVVYRERDGSAPQLMEASDGTVGVRGGVAASPADDGSPGALAAEETNPTVRPLSARPPGWPSGEPGADDDSGVFAPALPE